MADDYERRCAELDELVDTDPIRLRDEAIKLLAEVARLRAGEADEPAAENAWPTPAQWIRSWNQGTPEQRLAMADQILRNAQAAHDCAMAHGLRAQFDGKDTGRG